MSRSWKIVMPLQKENWWFLETKFRMSLIRCFRTGPEHEIPNELLTSTPYSQPIGIASDKKPPQSQKSAYYLCADKFSHTVHQESRAISWEWKEITRIQSSSFGIKQQNKDETWRLDYAQLESNATAFHQSFISSVSSNRRKRKSDKNSSD